MSKYKLASKKNLCPVCGAHKDCKELLGGTQILWLCKKQGSLNKGEKIPGTDHNIWICLKPAEAAIWATMAIADDQEITPEERAKRKADLDARQQEEKRKRQEALAMEMPAGERDEHYRKIFSRLVLTSGDCQNLLDRGFTEELLRLTGFISVDKSQVISGLYPDNLPGCVASGGNSWLQVSGPGILCPFPDEQGRIVGAQLRLRTTGEDESRYRWFGWNNASNLNGEKPIACWDFSQSEQQDRIWLAEGTGIKPALASYRLRAPVAGAAGGLFSSSPQNTLRTLEHLAAKYGTRMLVMAVDAGDVVNKDVIKRLQRQRKFLQDNGYNVTFAWWGQVTKEHDDIDELADLSAIAYLAPNQFDAIVAEANAPITDEVRSRSQLVVQPPRRDRREEAQQQAKEVKEARSVVRLQPPEIERPKGWKSWQNCRKFTPDIIQSSEFVKFDAPEPGTILAVNAGLGTGKTKNLEDLFAPGGAYEGKGAFGFFARNSLIYNFIGRIPSFTHLNEELLIMLRDPGSRFALCTNSLKKITNPEWFEGKILIIDEFPAVSLHLACSATHRKDRIQSLEIFKQAFTLCESVIILGGDLTDWQVEWAGKQAPNKKIVKLKNNGKRPRAKVEILLGTPTKSGSFDSAKLSPFIAPIVSANQPITIFTDSQKLGEQIELLLIDAGKKGLRIDSKTVYPKSEARLCLDNCKKWIEANLPDYLLCSPTSESGVDMNLPGYFSDSYGLFRGILATDQQMQMMARNRDPNCNWHISVPKQSFLRGSDKDYNLDNINAAANKLLELAEMDISHLRLNKDWLGETFLQYIEEAHNDVNNLFALKYRAKEAFEKENLRECLIFALEEAGHEINQTAYFENAKTEAELKAAGEMVKDATAAQIFHAEDITEKQAEDLNAKWASTWEDRVKLIKAGYKKLLPGIDETEFWNKEFIKFLKYDHPKAIAGAELLYLFKNPDLANKKQHNFWAKIATERAIFLPDITSSHLKVKALQFINFERFLDPDKTWHKNSPEILELVKLGNRPRVYNVLGLFVPKFTKGKRKGEYDGITYLRKLLGMVGLQLGPCQQKQVEGKRFNEYALDRVWLENPVRVAIADAVARRYEEFSLNWVMPEVLTTPVRDVLEAVEPPDLTNEPETDPDGLNWREIELEVKTPFGKLREGDRVMPISQPRRKGESENSWLIWIKSAVGVFLVDLGMLQLYFEMLPPTV
jgi:hypothetical protein